MINSLQSLRFVFISLVYASHIALYGHKFDFGGECGVAFFFFLSGFVLSVGYGERMACGAFRSRQFVLKQLIKLYPLHIVTMGLMVALDARLQRYYGADVLAANALLVQSWFPFDRFHFVANGVSWFLSDMIFFYVIAAPLYMAVTRARRRTLVTACAAAFAVWVVVTVWAPGESVNAVLYCSPLLRAVDFAGGIVLYRVYRSDMSGRLAAWLDDRGARVVTAMELTAAALVVASYFVYRELPTNVRCCGLFYIVIPVVVYVFAMTDRRGGALTRLLHAKALVRLGGVTFEIYMLHLVVARLLSAGARAVGVDQFSAVFAVACFAVTIACSFAVKKYFVDVIYSSMKNYVQKV